MSSYSEGLRSLSGLPLAEGALSRFIYSDEAGTSEHEPVRVVATVIVDGDKDIRPLSEKMACLVRENVPEELQKGFVIHATEIFSGGKKIDREKWPLQERVAFLKKIVALPLQFHVPIAVGICWKGSCNSLLKIIHEMLAAEGHGDKCSKLSARMLEHLRAFQDAMERSDCFLRKYLNGTEIGTVVAEDVPEMKRILAGLGLIYRELQIDHKAGEMRQNAYERSLGIQSEPVCFEIKHIIDVPHFVKKGGAPLLQLADVCAFSFRHALTRKLHGDELLLAMLGPHAGRIVLDDPVWFAGPNSGLFNTETYWTKDQKRGLDFSNSPITFPDLVSK